MAVTMIVLVAILLLFVTASLRNDAALERVAFITTLMVVFLVPHHRRDPHSR